MCEEFRRQVGIEVDGRLVDAHYDDRIANLSLDGMVSLVMDETSSLLRESV